MSWLRCSPFICDTTTVYSHLKHGLSFAWLSLLLKCTHSLSVPTSIEWSPKMFSKYWWISVGAIFFFCMEEFNDTPLLCTHFHIKCHFLKLSISCHLLRKKKFSFFRQESLRECWWDGSTSTAIPATSTCDIMSQHDKIGGINFGAALVHSFIWGL